MNRPAPDDRLIAIAAVLLALACLPALWRIGVGLDVLVPRDVNEGWNAQHALRALGGAPLYPGGDSLLPNNYPPLWFYLMGGMGRLVGDMIVGGRILAFASFLIVCAEVGVAARLLGLSRAVAAFAAAYFMAFMLCFSHYPGMAEPQMTAHAVAMAGLILVLAGRGRLWAGWAALPFFLALSIKHNLLALPLAIALWLASVDRRSAGHFVLCGLGAGLAGLAVAVDVFGPGFLAGLLAPRPYTLIEAVRGGEGWLVRVLPLLAGAVILGLRRWRRPDAALVCAYAVLSSLQGLVLSGGVGTDSNVFFDSYIALVLASVLALRCLAEEYGPLSGGARGRWLPVLVLVAPLMTSLALAQRTDWFRPFARLEPDQAEAEEWRRAIEFVRTIDGRVLCENQALCLWAGKHAEIDLFLVDSAIRVGRLPDTVLTGPVGRHDFALVVLSEPTASPPAFLSALDRDYRIDHAGPVGRFLVPGNFPPR